MIWSNKVIFWNENFYKIFCLIAIIFFVLHQTMQNKSCNLLLLKKNAKNPAKNQNILIKVKLYELKLKQKKFSFMFNTHSSDILAAPS